MYDSRICEWIMNFLTIKRLLLKKYNNDILRKHLIEFYYFYYDLPLRKKAIVLNIFNEKLFDTFFSFCFPHFLLVFNRKPCYEFYIISL